MKKIASLFLLLLLLGVFNAQAGAPLMEVIDVPTAEVLDRYGFDSSYRFYSEGGVLVKTHFGVFPRLNVGFGLDADGFVGNESVDLHKPTLNVRFRFFDGQRNLPALALGYDGQGLFFNKSTDKYAQREKGLFLVGSGEIIVPDLSLHGGINVYDFTEDHVYGFMGFRYLFRDVVALNAEWDNIRVGRDSRLNVGLGWWMTPSFAVELAGRDLGGPRRRPERIVRLVYSGGF
ncbi:MAG: hypothetical protein JNK54_05775 [Elusimicrobia bacterium]|nr:hypothetical protein [Elusimicrobiota bacterium]